MAQNPRSSKGLYRMAFFSWSERETYKTELVIAACSLVAANTGVRSVYIVTNGRPKYGDLSRYQEAARSRHVRLCLDGEGTIALRPEVHGEAGCLLDSSPIRMSTSIFTSKAPSPSS